MKTTVELPDELMRRVKIRAVENDQKLKDAFVEIIQRGLIPGRVSGRRRPLKLRGGFLPTTGEIEAAIAQGRE
jgi:plasmid stability protein